MKQNHLKKICYRYVHDHHIHVRKQNIIYFLLSPTRPNSRVMNFITLDLLINCKKKLKKRRKQPD